MLELTDPYVDSASGNVVVSMAAPVYSSAYFVPGQSRQLLGAMVVDVTVTDLVTKYQDVCSLLSLAAFGCNAGRNAKAGFLLILGSTVMASSVGRVGQHLNALTAPDSILDIIPRMTKLTQFNNSQVVQDFESSSMISATKTTVGKLVDEFILITFTEKSAFLLFSSFLWRLVLTCQ